MLMRVILATAMALPMFAPLVAGAESEAQMRPVKIAIAYFSHEATTFSPEKVGLDGFEPALLTGEALFAHGEEIQGFVKYAREQLAVSLVPLPSPGVVIGGSSKGTITAEAFEHYWRLMQVDLRAAMPVDAVFLSLHGAAAVEGIARPEAKLAKRVRAIVGPAVPIAGTFDTHGNEDAEFLRHANFSLVMKYFPHYDGRLQGERAARLLIRTARGDYRPTTATRKPGIITPTVLQWTGQEPWTSIVQRSLVWEARQPDVFVSYFFGFPWNDSPDAGATFQVMTNNNQALADQIAQDMNDYMWRQRTQLFSTPIIPPRQAVEEVLQATRAGQTPVVLADYSDRTGDATHILREIIAQDLGGVIVATLRDERAVAKLVRAGAKPGDPFDGEVGGFLLTPDSGKPVRIRGTVVYLGAQTALPRYREPVAAIEFGRGNLLVLTAELVQVVDPEQLRFGPVDPRRYTGWVIKSRAHFRRGFDDNGYARNILIVDAPGPYLGTVHLDALPYKHVELDKFFPFNAGGLDAARKQAAQ